MYAHQIVDNLESSSFLFGAKTRSVIEEIQSSVHFKFGDMSEILEFTRCENQIIPFRGTKWGVSAIPFPSLTISVSNRGWKDGSKFFFSVREEPVHGGISFLVFQYSSRVHGWGGVPFRFFFPDAFDAKSHDPVRAFKIKYGEMRTSEENFGKISGFYAGILNCVLVLLTIQNLTAQPHSPSMNLNKKRRKKGKCPLYTYHTLRLQLPGKAKKGKNNKIASPGTARLHLCRGHFKVYTEENPLLGKYTGRYWWQPHARGNRRRGVVMKDYAVTTSPETTARDLKKVKK